MLMRAFGQGRRFWRTCKQNLPESSRPTSPGHAPLQTTRTSSTFHIAFVQHRKAINMAPTKKDEKEVKLTPDQSAALILEYLRKQNRPYSATDISTNLKNRVTKSAAAKLLKDMHERNDIEAKAAGKQIVYHAIQVRLRDGLYLCDPRH